MKRIDQFHRYFTFIRMLCTAFFAFSCASSFGNPNHQKIFSQFVENYCLDCHDSESSKGNLNLESIPWNLKEEDRFNTYVAIFDLVRSGEMPPKKKYSPPDKEKHIFLENLESNLIHEDRVRLSKDGRHPTRRLNKLEHENKLREVLNAPWLQVAHKLPEDGLKFHFNKSSQGLDISHIQMQKYLEVAEYSLRSVMETVLHPTFTQKYYAREEAAFKSYLRYRWGQKAATRSIVPLIGTTPEPEVIRGNKPLSVGNKNPEIRENESMGVFSGTYQATTKYDFTRVQIPVNGFYKVRLKTYTFLAGLNGSSGGNDHGLTGGSSAWWRPNRNIAYPGKRSEPVTIYALGDSSASRWLTTFDSSPEPSIFEHEVILRKGEKIRPDATRLVRTRPGWKGNPNATKEGIPGVAFNWLEIEGPLYESWPPPSFLKTFGDLPYQVEDRQVTFVIPKNKESKIVKGSLRKFIKRTRPGNQVDTDDVERYFKIYQQGLGLGLSKTDSILSTYSAILCSGDFLFIENPGAFNKNENLANRLSYFLWNSPPDRKLLNTDLSDPITLRHESNRLINNPKFSRFINTFLDYWLELRDINNNTPDSELYPDYYLDDQLTESSLRETRLFFSHLIKENLPVANLVDSDFSFINERLAKHYELPHFEGADLIYTELPSHSPRGGLLTQAAILRVTANGTTTSPVIRGAWIMERILGTPIPPPPSGVEAIEPDTRGATTIKSQLEKHSSHSSCASCHNKFDPAGFALENFDVTGGWRDFYRAIDSENSQEPEVGFGKNGHAFTFHLAQRVESSHNFDLDKHFDGIQEFKDIILQDQRVIARNLLNQLIIFATGVPVSFSERAEVEKILDELSSSHFPIRSMIHKVVQSDLFSKQ